MKRLIYILFFTIFSCTVYAEIVNPVFWDIRVLDKDHVELVAEIDSGWHINVSEINGKPYDNVYHGDTSILIVNKSSPVTITYNACNDVMCTSPETIELTVHGIDYNEQQDNPLMACILICLVATLLFIVIYKLSK